MSSNSPTHKVLIYAIEHRGVVLPDGPDGKVNIALTQLLKKGKTAWVSVVDDIASFRCIGAAKFDAS